MSSFQFNFSVNDEEETSSKDPKNDENPNTDWYEAEEIPPCPEMIAGVYEIVDKAGMFIHGDLDIGYVYPLGALRYLRENLKTENNSVLDAEENHKDLVKGVYEGGLKIWECTHDLSEYLLKKDIDWKDKKVLDLGCGSGILGIIALRSGAEVHFQDYNKEVIEAMTVPNVLLNLCQRKQISVKSKFYSGDWGSLPSVLKCENDDSKKYDYILSSETIYNGECHEKFYNVIEQTLKNGGTAFIAAKTYYFGVGGGLQQFESLVNKKGKMKYECCWKSDSGVTREIIELTHLEKT